MPFIVCARQARYYALTAALVLAVMGTYAVLLRRAETRQPMRAASVAFATAAMFLVLSFDVIAIGVLGAAALHWLAFRRSMQSKPSGATASFWFAWGAATIVLALWILLSLSAPVRQANAGLSSIPVRLRYGIPYYVAQIDAHVVPVLLGLPVLALSFGRRTRSGALFLALFAAGAAAGAMLSPYRFFRYIVPVVTLIFALAALGLADLWQRGRWHKAMAALVIVAMVSSTAPHVLSHSLMAAAAKASGLVLVRERDLPMRVPLADLLREFRDPPRGPIAATVGFLRENAQARDVLVTTYGELPLKFHTALDVYGGETAQLPPAHVKPRWIWPRHRTKVFPAERAAVTWVEQELSGRMFERIELDAFDRRWENREDPESTSSQPGSASTQSRNLSRDRLMKIQAVKATGRWLCLAGLLLMITGDSPRSIPVIRAPWLYLVLLLLGSVFFAAGGLKPRRRTCVDAIAKPLALLLGAFLLSAVASSIPILSARSFLAVLTIVAAGWVFVSVIEDERFRHAIGPVVSIAVLLLAVRIIVWRYEEGLLTEAFHVGNNAWRGKIQLTWVLNLFAPLLLAWAVTARRRRLSAFYAAIWVVAGAALYFLQARMGLIVFAMTAAGVLMFTLNQWRRALAVVIVAAAIGVTLIGRTTELAQLFVSTIADPALNPGIDMRLGIWKDTLRLIQSRPFLGHGLGTYDAVAYTLENTTAVPYTVAPAGMHTTCICTCWRRLVLSAWWRGATYGFRYLARSPVPGTVLAHLIGRRSLVSSGEYQRFSCCR